MNVGTTEPLQGETIVKPRRTRASGRGGSGGRNGQNGGGDGPGPNKNGGGGGDTYETGAVSKSKVVTAFLLLAVMMTFGGLIATYVVVSTNGAAEWRPFSLPAPVWVSTVLILLSSLTYHFAERSFDTGNQSAARSYLLGTTVLGAAFISSQILAWLALVERGLYIAGNPYAGFFYMLTVVHAAHVLGGVIALGSIILRSWLPTIDDDELTYRRNLARSVGWYWHFVGALWIVLLSLLAFWK